MLLRPRSTGGHRSTWIVLGLAAAVLLATPSVASAQYRGGSWYLPEQRRWLDSGLKEELGFASANALLNGVVTGLFRAFSDDGSFLEGFLAGAAGGGVTYAGKRLAAQHFDGAGLVGRQVASLGGSITANARDGRGAFDRWIFQLGLGRLYWDRTASSVTFRPDVVTISYGVLGLANGRLDFDLARSLSNGALVFLTKEDQTTLDRNAAGRAFGGVILADVNANLRLVEIAAHERVHVLQYDQNQALWGEAADRAFFSLFGPTVASVTGRVDISLMMMPSVPLLGAIPRENNPLEVEADFLTVR